MTADRPETGGGEPSGQPAEGPEIFLSVGEPSGDMHGAALIRAIRKLIPGCGFVGVAGPRMQAEGCRAIADLTQHASMLLGSVRLLGRGWRALRAAKHQITERRPALGVMIDSPMLNLAVARQLRRRGVPVLYFIAPQTWAWAEYRIRKVARRVDRLAVILPFEEAYFRRHGLEATYVGHPLFDTLADRKPDQGLIDQLRSGARSVIALLPGSRRQVVREVLPGQLEVADQLTRRFRGMRVVLSLAGEAVRPDVEELVAGSGVRVQIHEGHNGELLTAADLVLVASGTATLEVAYYHKPMIVMYNHQRLLYNLIGRRLITTEFLSLPNIIAGRRIVPEFMPYYRSTAPITALAVELLSYPWKLERTSNELRELMAPLVRTGASDNTARIVAEMIAGQAPRAG
jgi:lipid-A-disaccharide synthase